MRLSRFLPKKLQQLRRLRRDVAELAKVNSVVCDAAPLADVPDIESVSESEWRSVEAEAKRLSGNDLKGAVNPGDRRAIYQLTRALGARSVLEIGTWVGASTLMFAMALRSVDGARLISVDILDVNAPRGPWQRLGARCPPRQLIQEAGCGGFVQFFASPSLDFLKQCNDRFDLIFLDGLHEARTVYQEVPLALKLLNPGGLILLHDFFPDAKPLWSDGAVDPGPWLAISRLLEEQAPFAVKRFTLSWPTKFGSNETSLACLVRP